MGIAEDNWTVLSFDASGRMAANGSTLGRSRAIARIPVLEGFVAYAATAHGPGILVERNGSASRLANWGTYLKGLVSPGWMAHEESIAPKTTESGFLDVS